MISVATVSYLTAAAAFLGLALMVLLRWRDRPGSLWVLIAALLSVAWALFLAYISLHVANGGVLSGGMLEVGRNAGWFAVMLSVLAVGGDGARMDVRTLRLWIALTAGFLLATSVPIALPFWGGSTQWHGLALLMMSIAGLVLVEQVYRNTPPQRRWGVKFLAVGIGTLFAFDLFVLADLVLFETLESPTRQARGFVNALAVPLIAVAISRQPAHRTGLVVSRKVMFHTTALTGAGLYLLAVGAAGYYLRHASGELGALLQATFLVGAALMLALVLFSGTFRARLRVFLSKHFFKYKYDYREEWLRFTQILSTEDVTMPFNERAIHAIGSLVESPAGMLWIRSDDGSFTLEGIYNLDPTDLPPEAAEGPLVEFLDRTGWVIDVNEYQNEPAIYRGAKLPSWLLEQRGYWAVIPLLKADGLEGFVVLANPLVPRRIDWEERDLLKAAGRQLSVYVALANTGQALLEARQFEALHRLTAFLVHDLKNVSAQLSLICANAERHRDNPAFVDDAFRTVGHARDRLERTQAQLRNVQARPDNPRHVIALPKLLHDVVSEGRASQPEPILEIRDPAEVTGDREALKNVLLHLVRNAQEATPDHGRVALTLYTEGASAIILVEDNGSGIDEEFLRRRLFRPFQTTKGNAGMGIGLYETRDQIARMGGRIDVSSRVGEGTLFTLRLPRHEVAARVADEPLADEHVTDTQVADKQVANEPATNEPATNEPVANQQVADEPVANEQSQQVPK